MTSAAKSLRSGFHSGSLGRFGFVARDFDSEWMKDFLGNGRLHGQSPTNLVGTALDFLRFPDRSHGPRVIVEFPVSACFNRRSTTDAHPALAFRPTLPALVRTHGNGLVYPRRRRTSRTIEVTADLELGNTVSGLRGEPRHDFRHAITE